MAASLRQQAKAIEDSKEAAPQSAPAPASVKARQLPAKSRRVKKASLTPGKTSVPRPARKAKRKDVSKRAA